MSFAFGSINKPKDLYTQVMSFMVYVCAMGFFLFLWGVVCSTFLL